MKLLTHNFLMCNNAGCVDGYPLEIRPQKETSVIEAEFSPDFVKSMLGRLEWKALLAAAKSINIDLPIEYNQSDLENEMFLKSVHNALLEVHVTEGMLVCPRCAREYQISRGIPDMLPKCNEDNNKV